MKRFEAPSPEGRGMGKGRGTDTVPAVMDLPREKVLDLIPYATERETNFIRETGAGGDE